MPDLLPSSELPPLPEKRYFTIGEVSELCGVKPHVLRYWEQEFTQLKPVKRRGNRRYYQHHEVMLVRHIRELLYEQGFTINGARNKLGQEKSFEPTYEAHALPVEPVPVGTPDATPDATPVAMTAAAPAAVESAAHERPLSSSKGAELAFIKQEIAAILELLRGRDV